MRSELARRVTRLAWLCVVSLCGARAGAEPERPNIVLLMADDLGWGDTGYNGHPTLRTPHLDRMSREGLRFDRWYAQSAVCSPTRGSCLTGRHPSRYGVTNANAGHMLAEELTLAELVKAHGYVTGHFGKWHLGTLTRKTKDSNRGGPRGVKHYSTPAMNGFDEYFSTEAKVPTWDPLVKPPDAGRKHWNALAPGAPRVDYGTLYWVGEEKRAAKNLGGDDSRVIMDRVIPFVERAAGSSTPFLAVVWFHAPHLPVVAGPKYRALYSGHSNYERNYWGCITALDEQIGRLRAALDRFGIAKRTMLWFSSDNGPEGKSGVAPGSAGAFRGRKRSLYEGGIRVPGLLVWPERIELARSTSVPATTSDYLPTIAELLEAKALERPLDGVSLLPLIDGEVDTRPRPVGFRFREQSALVGDRFKLYRRGSKAEYELYDLLDDPGESRDVATVRPEIVREMRKALEDWQRSCETQ